MDSLQLAFHPDARSDALDAYDWYSQRSPQAAAAFQDELRDAGLAIQRNPERWARYRWGTRRYLMKRFPFLVAYRVTSTRIEVLAVAHGRRRPGYWKARQGST